MHRGPVVLTLALIALLLAGSFFRFHNLDRKIYWNDEVWTSLWLSGHRGSELIERLFDGRELTVENLQQFQRLDAERGWTATIAAVAADDPKQGPLYYALLRLWAALFGDSIYVLRSLSAVISLLALPALYWLCRELFAEARTAWTAVALMAISPFHLLYAQEASVQPVDGSDPAFLRVAAARDAPTDAIGVEPVCADDGGRPLHARAVRVDRARARALRDRVSPKLATVARNDQRLRMVDARGNDRLPAVGLHHRQPIGQHHRQQRMALPLGWCACAIEAVARRVQRALL